MDFPGFVARQEKARCARCLLLGVIAVLKDGSKPEVLRREVQFGSLQST